MPPPTTEKRVRTNDHPGLIVKNVRRSKAEVAADKATKEAKAAIAAADDEKAFARLAGIELEQENTEKTRRKAVVRKQPASHKHHDSRSGRW
jgi:hypothetical protein